MKKNKREKFVEKVKRSNILILTGIILLFLSSLITITNGTTILINYYQGTLGYRSQWTNILSKLSADTNITYFQNLIGNPVFVNKMENGDSEYIFVNNLFYVQAITDKDQRVLAYSVTTRSKDFNPSLKFVAMSFGEVEDFRTPTVVLGKTTFSELGKILAWAPINIVSYLGAHDYFYSEEYRFGNPGNYQTFFFAQNQAGYVNNVYPAPALLPVDYNHVSSTYPGIQAYRDRAIINTYTVTAPFIGPKEMSNDDSRTLILGPDYNQVRILNE